MRLTLQSEFLRFLAEHNYERGQRLPASQALAQELGISTSKLREQLEVARSLGLVEVRPKTGIRTTGYSFRIGIQTSLAVALQIDPTYFDAFGDLRNRLEAAYWHEAVRLLHPEDMTFLQDLVERAWRKLHGSPIQIPHEEHRELHLLIFSRLENPFVVGLLEAYWDAYETVGLNIFSDFAYLERVWNYHQQMVDAIMAKDFEAGYHALVEHMGILQDRKLTHRPNSTKVAEMTKDFKQKSTRR
jgi:DNA-binding FadR family transcriptional regulator